MAKTKIKKETKTQKVLDHLIKYGSITSWQAIELYGATRLSAIIYNLKKKHKINSVDISGTDRLGNPSTFSKYIYCGEV